MAMVKQLNNSWIELEFCVVQEVQRFLIIGENVGPAHFQYEADTMEPQTVMRPSGGNTDDVILQAKFELEPNNEYRFFIIGYATTDERHAEYVLFGQIKVPACDYTECVRRGSDKYQCLTTEMQCNGIIECRDNEDESFCGNDTARSLETGLGDCITTERSLEDLHRLIPPICSEDGWWSPLQCYHMEQFELCDCVDKHNTQIMDTELFFMEDTSAKSELHGRCLLERERLRLEEELMLKY